MSVKRRADTGKWSVRWRDGGRGSRQRSQDFDRRSDALAFDREVARRKQIGLLGQLDAGQQTLAEFVPEWWRGHAVPNLEPSTRRRYAEVWDRHVLPHLGGYSLRDLTPKVIDRYRSDLTAAGVPDPTVLKGMTVLSSVLSLAVVHEEIVRNPVHQVRKPRQTPARRAHPLTPSAVEDLRSRLQVRDATLVSVLAYAGLRPGEALGLRWEAIGKRAIAVDRAVSLGEEKERTKTRRWRTVRLLTPLAHDLAQWRMALARSGQRELVFPRSDGSAWQDHDWRNWRRRCYQAEAARAALGHTVPYDLRHSFASLLISEGQNVIEVARQMGHSPAVCLSTYAHLFEEWDPSDRIPAEERIRAARVREVFSGANQASR